MAIESFRLAVAATALVAATFYIVFGKISYSKRRKRGPRGLTNTNRACFMNAVLQAFASTTVFQQWLKKCQSSPLKQGLVKCLNLINRLEDSPSEEVTPTELFAALRSQGFVLTGEEQDAHELVQGLLDVIESDQNHLSQASKPRENPLQLNDAQNDDSLASKPSGVLNRLGGRLEPLSTNSSFERIFPFTGSVVNCVNQNQKQRSPAKSLAFNNITLYLPSVEERLVHDPFADISLESLLQSFVKEERVEEASDTGTTKQQSFAKLPTCLCLHIQRTAFDGVRAYKRREKVTFPFFLQMDQFIYSKQLCNKLSEGSNHPQRASRSSTSVDDKKNSYSLCAVICHLGDIESGHYICYRKCVISGGKVRWFCTSDVEVNQVTLELVMSANPYILLYERFNLKTETFTSMATADNPLSVDV